MTGTNADMTGPGGGNSFVTRNYYETYWSSGGFCPHGTISPAACRLFERYVEKGSSCLDFGCGDGRSSGLWLRDHGMRYVGVDLSENAIEMARGIGLTAHRVDGEDLPFDSGTFDVAIAFEVFEHLFNPHHAAGELLRVLKPGGVLLGTVPNVAFWRRRFELAIHGVWNPYGDFLSVREPWR